MYKELQDLNTKVFAISVDNSEKAEIMKEKTKASFDFLCDESMEVINLYDLKDHELMNWDFIDGKVRKTKTSRSISLSAYVLINNKGYIPYSWSGHYSLKPKIEDVIEVLKKIGG
jgi:peroxiredoxin